MSGWVKHGLSHLCGLVILIAVIGCQVLPFSADNVEVQLLEVQDSGDSEEKNTADSEDVTLAFIQVLGAPSVIRAGTGTLYLRLADGRPPLREVLIPPPDSLD
jgi:uncharacterized protein YqhQ